MTLTNLLPISIFTFKSQFLLKSFFYNSRIYLKIFRHTRLNGLWISFRSTQRDEVLLFYGTVKITVARIPTERVGSTDEVLELGTSWKLLSLYSAWYFAFTHLGISKHHDRWNIIHATNRIKREIKIIFSLINKITSSSHSYLIYTI